MRLVSFIVRRKYNDSKEPAEDLVSIGSIGLVKAVSAYDVTKPTPFGTYAAICIDNEIKMYFRKTNKTAGEISMSDQFGEEGGTILDKLTADDDPLMDVISLLNSRAVYKAVNTSLNLRERHIISRRYGLNFKGKSVIQTQEQIGGDMGISRAYVSRIEKTATEKLKRYFAENGCPDVY
jgi:RNA polymerase sporulation-specific sigma factor